MDQERISNIQDAMIQVMAPGVDASTISAYLKILIHEVRGAGCKVRRSLFFVDQCLRAMLHRNSRGQFLCPYRGNRALFAVSRARDRIWVLRATLCESGIIIRRLILHHKAPMGDLAVFECVVSSEEMQVSGRGHYETVLDGLERRIWSPQISVYYLNGSSGEESEDGSQYEIDSSPEYISRKLCDLLGIEYRAP